MHQSSKTKIQVRAEFREKLRQHPADGAETHGAVEALNERLVGFIEKQLQTNVPDGTVWAGFQPSGFEPDIRPAMHRLNRDLGVNWVYPRVEDEHMVFYRLPEDAIGDEKSEPALGLVKSKWGILEPDPSRSEKVSPKDIAGYFVPALAFDLQCNRLGRGKGYYDRALAESPATKIKIGIALDRQVSEETFAVDPFDVPMDWVVTETRTLRRAEGSAGTASRRPEKRTEK